MLLVASVLAGGDSKDGAKSKRAYSLGYGYQPYYYDHDVINHPPIVHHAPVATVHHAPVATVHHAPVATVHHAPVAATVPVVHAPVVAHTPVVSAIAPVSKVTSSVVSTNVHHYPNYHTSYFAPHAPFISSASYYQAPAVGYHAVAPAYHSPLYSEFHWMRLWSLFIPLCSRTFCRIKKWFLLSSECLLSLSYLLTLTTQHKKLHE